MSTETESDRACLGWQCLVAKPENPEQAGWRDGYCPDCQDELARDEIRAERQDAGNEVERPLSKRVPAGHAAPWVVEEIANLERQLAEALDNYDASEINLTATLADLRDCKAALKATIEQRDRLAEALRKIQRRTVIAGSVAEYRRGQVDALSACSEVASTALATLDRKESQ